MLSSALQWFLAHLSLLTTGYRTHIHSHLCLQWLRGIHVLFPSAFYWVWGTPTLSPLPLPWIGAHLHTPTSSNSSVLVLSFAWLDWCQMRHEWRSILLQILTISKHIAVCVLRSSSFLDWSVLATYRFQSSAICLAIADPEAFVFLISRAPFGHQ